MKKLFFTVVVALLTFNSQAQNWSNSKKIKGNGNVITKTRSINNFDKVNIGGSFDVNLVAGTKGKITINGEENLLPYLETTVKKGKLKVQFKENVNIKTTKRLTVTIPFKSIDAVSLGGSGKVTVHKQLNSNDISFNIGGSGNISASVNSNTVKASIGGSGSINLKGKSENLKCSIAGSGSVKAYNLNVKTVKASIAGSGNVQTTVTEKIKASIVGSGSVYYKGNPNNIDNKSVGSGDVVDKN